MTGFKKRLKFISIDIEASVEKIQMCLKGDEMIIRMRNRNIREDKSASADIEIVSADIDIASADIETPVDLI